ncbi:cilia- and flagella-associated protein 69-like isoform X2 [Ischnura elegans]|uniref:cilia- and flagella-associated protein 69-like isoform X2 n=1 Tax=Ischnura elegans TaxID=197161 RepID=UPI001ED87D7A|nr:cilia- and flagella-associated protein 69-like isoform X2 [Ischnura elegans]
MDFLVNYFSHFGEILIKVPEDIQLSLINAVYPTLVCQESPVNNIGSNLDAAIKGSLPETFVNLMRITASLQVYKKLLKLNSSLILISSNWSEGSRSALVKKEPLSSESLISLDAVLHHYLKMKSDKKRRIRNEIVMLFLLLADIFLTPDAITCGFAQDILLLSVATEIPMPRTNKISFYQFEATDFDMEFKKSLLLSATKFIDIPQISTVMNELKFLQGVLMILHPREASQQILWGPVHWKEIQTTTLTILPLIIPISIKDFASSDSGKKLIGLSYHFLNQRDCESVLLYMKALSAVHKANDLASLEYLLKIDAMQFLKDIIKKQLDLITQTPKAQSIILHALLLMNYLVIHPRYDLEMEGKALLSLLISILNTFSSSADGTYANTCLLISAVNLIRECLLKSDTSKKFFTEIGGIFNILDLMKGAPLLVKTICLSILAHLSLNRDCVMHMLEWRGGQCLLALQPPHQDMSPCKTLEKSRTKSQETWLLPMLMQIWRQEEESLQVLRTSGGVITDFRAPLMGKDQRIWMNSEQKQLEDSFSFAEINTSARSKIYCIISLLKYHSENRTNPFNAPFKSYVDAISRKDQVTLKLVENYQYLKTGEMWLEEMLKSHNERFRPSTIDLICERNIKWTKCVNKDQELLTLKGTNTELKTEETAYKCIRNAHLAPEYESVRELQFQARTSNAYTLKKAKDAQREEILESLKFPQDSINHRTYPARAKPTVIAPSKTLHENLDPLNKKIKFNVCSSKVEKNCHECHK